MNKKEKYKSLISQIKSITESESDLIANLSNVIALIHHEFQFWWTGFYFVKDKELVLGPFQGPLACTRIPFGKGVCGTAWENGKTLIVDNVHEFSGHIACSSESNSEIVIPILRENKIIAVLDIDSKEFSCFDEIDAQGLEEIVSYISTFF